MGDSQVKARKSNAETEAGEGAKQGKREIKRCVEGDGKGEEGFGASCGPVAKDDEFLLIPQLSSPLV